MPTPRSTRDLAAALVCFALTLLTLVVGLHGDEKPVVGNLTMLNAATTGSGTAVSSAAMSHCRESAIYIRWEALTTAGTILVETAHDTSFTGTWANLATVNWPAANREDVVQITGIHGAIRTRISTLTGGSVSSWLNCN